MRPDNNIRPVAEEELLPTRLGVLTCPLHSLMVSTCPFQTHECQHVPFTKSSLLSPPKDEEAPPSFKPKRTGSAQDWIITYLYL